MYNRRRATKRLYRRLYRLIHPLSWKTSCPYSSHAPIRPWAASTAYRALFQEQGFGLNGLRLLDLLFQQPLVNVNLAKDYLDISYKPANRLIEQVTQAGLLEEITGAQRNRRYRYTAYLVLFDEPSETDADAKETRR